MFYALSRFHRRIFCLLVFLCAFTVPIAAESLGWDAGPGTSEEENGAVLANDLLYRKGNGQNGPKAGPKAPVVQWYIPAGAAGRYRATLRTRTEKLGVSNTTLQAWVDKETTSPIAAVPVGGHVFSAPGKWQEFTLDFVVEAGKAVTAGLMYLGDKDPPASGIIQVEVASLKLVKLDTPVVAGWARSRKIRYRHSEQGTLDLRLTNTTDQPQTVSVRPVIVNDSGLSTPGAAQPFTIPAGNTLTGAAPFAVPAGDGGYALLAEVLQGDKVIDRQDADVFCVADSPFLCAIQPSGGLPRCGPAAHPLGLKGFKAEILDKWDEYTKTATTVVENIRRNYITYYEYFAWAHEDATILVEETDEPYLGGQAGYPASRKQFRLLNSLLRAQGIAPVAYMNSCPFGWPGHEVARKRPEWFNITGSSLNTAHWEKYRNGIQPPYVYPTIWANFEAVSPIDGKTYLQFHTEQMVASVNMYGWEAFRYDAGPLPPKYFPSVKQTLAKLNPPVAIGNNMGICNLGPLQSDKWKLYCQDGSYMMEELINDAFNSPNSPRRKWVDFIEYLRLGSHLTRSNSGHYTWINHSGNYYSCALGYSVGGHPWSLQKNPYGDSERFMVRFGYYFWDLRSQMLPEPEKTLAVTGERPLWWKQLVSERKLENGRRQIIVPLINPPAEETADGKTMVGPAAGATVTFKPQAGEKTTVWLLSPEPTARREQLTARTLPDGRVQVTVPLFWVWSNVVFDCNR
ncbi:MAG: hypothetical protein ACYC7E_03020 [Armatimonadota bacterium]